MAETIYTIPINEAFDTPGGCPLCALRQKLETESLEYIMGAAMMEPDVRQETNRLGFCPTHYGALLKMKNRLSLALTLESHLAQSARELLTEASGGRRLFGKKDAPTPGAALTQAAGSCYVCTRMADFEKKYVQNTVYLWKSDANFQKKFSARESFCLRHAGLMLRAADSELSTAAFEQFQRALLDILRRHAAVLQENLGGFIRSYDHRSAGVPLTDAQRSAVEDTIAFLAGNL